MCLIRLGSPIRSGKARGGWPGRGGNSALAMRGARIFRATRSESYGNSASGGIGTKEIDPKYWCELKPFDPVWLYVFGSFGSPLMFAAIRSLSSFATRMAPGYQPTGIIPTNLDFCGDSASKLKTAMAF